MSTNAATKAARNDATLDSTNPECALYAKLLRVTQAVQRLPKSGYNSFHQYRYATEADLVEHLRSLLVQEGLMLWTTVADQTREGEFTKVCLEFRIMDTATGATLTAHFWGEGQDKGDKGLYKAYTGALKYFLMKVFLVPTGDDPEADHRVDERNAAPPPTAPAPRPPGPPAASCSRCQASVTPAVVTFSQRKYGRPLCMMCQREEGTAHVG